MCCSFYPFLCNILCRWLIAFIYKYCCMRLLNIVPGFLLNISNMVKIFLSNVDFLTWFFHIAYDILLILFNDSVASQAFNLLFFHQKVFYYNKSTQDVMKSLDWLKMKQLSIFNWTAYWWRCYYTNWMCVAFLLD